MDLNHGPIGLQPIALPLSYIPTTEMLWSKWGQAYKCGMSTKICALP